MDQQPTVVGLVHYVSHGTPVRPDGSQAYTSQCRAAIITEITSDPDHPGQVGLAVLNPEGFFFNHAVPYHDGAETPGNPDCPAPHADGPFRYCSQRGCDWREAAYQGGTWHWPERVE